MRNKRLRNNGVRFTLIGIAAVVFAIAAITGYAYGQNTVGGGHDTLHSSTSGSVAGATMPVAECDQMMQSLNISQSTINTMEQMMSGIQNGGMQGMMQGN